MKGNQEEKIVPINDITAISILKTLEFCKRKNIFTSYIDNVALDDNINELKKGLNKAKISF